MPARAALAISFVCCTLAVSADPARADVNAQVPNGTIVTGTLSPASETERFNILVPAGCLLTVEAKAKKAGPTLLVRLE